MLMILKKIKTFMNQDAFQDIPPELLANLKKKYLEALPEKFSEIDRLIINLKKTPNKQDLISLQFIIHKFAGNAGMFGYMNITVLSRGWDEKLQKIINSNDLQQINDSFFNELLLFIGQIKRDFNL